MNFFIINCHTANRGDEAAVHALVDELLLLYPKAKITLGMRGSTRYPNFPTNVKQINQLIIDDNIRYKYKYVIAKVTKGKIAIGRTYNTFINTIKTADIILHAPGGPSIGDTYYDTEKTYLYVYDLIRIIGKPYMFYAPSMGPFNRTDRNRWRKKVLNSAQAVALRDPISVEHVRQLLPDKEIYQTLDSAFQHDIDMEINRKKLNTYKDLKSFIENHKKCIGITITDLLWHPVHSKNQEIVQNIYNCFKVFLKELVQQGYGIIFIPQLYGTGNDYMLMCEFVTDEANFFIIQDNDDRYDTYFQQYLISQLYAVIGMRYHSNIFSAKMGTPFISVSYEQKMQGFMEKMGLSQYCITLNSLSLESLREKIKLLISNYEQYKTYLKEKHVEMKMESYRTTELVKEILDKTTKEHVK